MATSTDYWLQGMQVADSEHKNYLDNQQKNRDYAAKHKEYYGEDWRGDEKGNTDFGASEAARKARMDEDALAAANVYLNPSSNSFGRASDSRPVEGTTLSDYGVPKSTVINPDVARAVPVNDLGAPSATPAAPVKVIAPPVLLNTDSAEGDYGNWQQTMASLPVKPEVQVQPDAPQVVPVQNNLGSPAPAITAPAPVNVAPAITQDFGLSSAPAAPVTPRSPVPNTSTFGVPSASLPTAQQIYDRVDPDIRSKPAFLNELRKYEQNRIASVEKQSIYESLARTRGDQAVEAIRARGEETRLTNEEKSAVAMQIASEHDKNRLEGIRLNTASRELISMNKAAAAGVKLTDFDSTLVKKYATEYADKDLADKILNSDLGIIENPSTSTPIKYATAYNMYKTVNSLTYGRDAVNGEEAKRVGFLLESNWNPVKMIYTGHVLPDLNGFVQEIRLKQQGIQKQKVDLLQQKNDLYRKNGWDAENNTRIEKGAPSATPPLSNPASTNAPSYKPVTVNSQSEYDALPKGAQYIDSNGKSATKR